MYWSNELVELPNCVRVQTCRYGNGKIGKCRAAVADRARRPMNARVFTYVHVVWASGGVGSSPGVGLVSEVAVYVCR